MISLNSRENWLRRNEGGAKGLPGRVRRLLLQGLSWIQTNQPHAGKWKLSFHLTSPLNNRYFVFSRFSSFGGTLTEDRLQQLESSLQELQSINRVVEKVCRLRETNHIMSVIIDELSRLTGASQGIVSLLPSVQNDEMITVARKMQPVVADVPFKVGQTISGFVLHHRQQLKIDDLDHDERFNSLSSEGGKFKSLLCCPMIARGEIIGLTTLVRDAGTGPFTAAHARLAGIIVSQSGQILANALLLEELARKNDLLEISQAQLSEENSQLKVRLGSSAGFDNIICKSPAMKDVLILASKAATHDSPVLITGATGTGKEVLARAIHSASRRHSKPFVVKNCGIKTESLLEAELFGHTKGAFTGAERERRGLFREAQGGTIFLDEIGEAPPSIQVAILRVLESGEIRPLGVDKPEHVDVRIISATNRKLRDEIASKNFREDLFYRLNTFTIDMPTLAERREDIPLLVKFFLNRIQAKRSDGALSISSEAMSALCAHNWPGNVRELEHEVERASIVCSSEGIIETGDLSPHLKQVSHFPAATPECGSLRDAVESVERNLITKTLADNHGNILRSAKELGLTRKGLRDKIARYGIPTLH